MTSPPVEIRSMLGPITAEGMTVPLLVVTRFFSRIAKESDFPFRVCLRPFQVSFRLIAFFFLLKSIL